MNREIFTLALEAEGIKADKTGYALPVDRDASVLMALPGDVYSVDHVVRIELREKFLLLETSKREHFVFAYEALLGLRIQAGRERTAGFAR